MSQLPTSELLSIASRRVPGTGSARERYDAMARRQAAAALLEQRADPMAYIQRGGQINTQGFADALQQGGFATVGLHLRQRQAVVSEHTAMLGPDIPLVSQPEAAMMRRALDALPVQARQAALVELSRGVTDQRALARVAGLVYRDAPGAQLGMLIQGRTARFDGAPNLTTEIASRRLLEGAHALGMVQQQNTPTEQSADRARRTFAMPSDGELRRAWANEVGDAYLGAPETEAAAFEAFRAAYAGAAIEAGQTDGVYNGRFAREAAAIATGGIMRDGDRRVLLPWGMGEDQFRGSIARGWSGIQERLGGDLTGQNASRFTFQADGSGRYAVMTRQGAQAKDAEGRPIYITVPRQ